MGEYEHGTVPKPETSHRCRVYQFGVRWHWKCPHCKHGGPSWTQRGAMDAATEHVTSQPWIGIHGQRITYEQALAESSDLEYLGHA